MRTEFVDPRRDPEATKSIWVELSGVSPHSYFLSWSWVETWLETLPDYCDVKLAVVVCDGKPAIACFVGFRKITRHGFVTSRSCFVNETGFEDPDSLVVEFNGVLSRPDTFSTASHLLSAIEPSWDEIHIRRAERGVWEHVSVPGTRVFVTRTVPSPFVKLAGITAVPDYLGKLSSNTRQQIRRAYRLYEDAYGPVYLEYASNHTQAMDIYSELVALHQARWIGVGKPGAFASKYFSEFHTTLIERCFKTGEIQLLRIKAGSETIGCFYNFCYKGKVYCYQSGVRHHADNRFKAGMLCDTEAIVFNARAGNQDYDFLGGSSRYKRTLATQARELSDVVVQRDSKQFKVERVLKDMKRRLHPLRSR